jgi:hypothetical protein
MQKNHEFEKILNSLGIEDYMPRAKGRITVAESSKRQADGITFDSMIEKDAYLLFKEAFGTRKFVIQPKFLLQPGYIDPDCSKVRTIYYIADFAFYTNKTEFTKKIPEQVVVVDIKGMIDPVFKLKQKMFTYKFNKTLYLPKTKKQIKDLIEIIKQRNESTQSKNRKK